MTTMRRIKRLDPRLANQIAAGEVIERPASVLKELLENSLDAGATALQIEIERGGARRIQVTDNGSGVEQDDMLLTVDRHATSKVYSFEELQHIQSLGFRGEALASIASVSHLQLTSKTAGAEAAWQVSIGEDISKPVLKPAAHPNGTTVLVQDLFFNVPARRKFLRTDKTEFAHIETLVKRLALSRPEVRIKLVRDSKRHLDLPAASSAEQVQQRVAKICGRAFIDNAWHLDIEAAGLRLSGWVGHPDFTRHQTDLQYSYVNGRMVRDKLITHAIKQCYEPHLYPGCQPCYVLFLSVDPGEVDVNVHPTKHELRFRQARLIHDFITHSLSQVFAPELVESAGAADLSTATQQSSAQAVTPHDAFEFIQPSERISREAFSDALARVNTQPAPSPNAASTEPASAQLSVRPAPMMRDNAQPTSTNTQYFHIKTCLYNQYLIVSGMAPTDTDPQALSLIDGHALQYALAQRTLKAEHEASTLTSQTLLLPETITLEAAVVRWTTQLEDSFAQWGFVVNCVDVEKLIVRQVPKLCLREHVSACVSALVKALSGEVDTHTVIDIIAKAGVDKHLQDWSNHQYQTLLNQALKLDKTERRCVPLSQSELARWF